MNMEDTKQEVDELISAVEQTCDSEKAMGLMAASQNYEALSKQMEEANRRRVEEARLKIQAILDEYGLKLEGVVTIPATEIRIVPRGK